MRFNYETTKDHAQFAVAMILIASVLFLAAAARNVTAQSFSMPEEQINYTITNVNGVPWAKIDGTYPITYNGTETSIPMVYPTPPETTNITVWLNDVELNWTNFTEAYPDALHRTAIGDWAMISTVLENVTGSFVLRIQYEHPVQVINGSYVFLYDLNIADYLSALDNRSVAHFTIRMETEYANLKINTVFGADETLKPINFAVSSRSPSMIKVDEVSEFGKPLPGDLLVSFSGAESQGNDLWVAVSVFVVGFALVGLLAYGLLRRRRSREAR